MSVASPTLPAGWSNILAEMQAHLDRALAADDERIGALPTGAESAVPERQGEIARWSERLSRLSAYLESAEQLVQSVDEVLEKEETQLRQEVAACGTVRQRLADGMGRAIG